MRFAKGGEILPRGRDFVKGGGRPLCLPLNEALHVLKSLYVLLAESST